MKFCDRLHVWQEFLDWKGGDFLGGRVISIEGACGFGRAVVVHEETGEVGEAWAVSGSDDVEYSTAKYVRHGGSYETSIRIRMVNRKLEVLGNPSSWGRLDNVFGVGVDDGMAIYNEILRGLGLPEFSSGEVVTQWLQNEQKHVTRYTGAHITHCDITENFAVGMGNVSAYHRWLLQQKMYRSAPGDEELEKFAQWNYSTVHTSSSAFWLNVKHYDKATALEERTLPEYMKKLREAARAGRIAKSEVRPLFQEAEDYIGKLAEWCAEVGMTRGEWSFRSRWFLQHEGSGWWRPGETEALLLEHVEREQEKIAMRAVVYQQESYLTLSAQAQGTWALWEKGHDVKSLKPRNTFYRHRREILEKTGHDIAARPLRSGVTDLRPVFFRVRPLSLADAPAWYVRPSCPELRAA